MKKAVSLLLSLALALSLCVPVLAAGEGFQKVYTYTPGQFADVPPGSWCDANVQTVYEYGIMNGTTAASFSPGGSLSVAQALVIACRLHSMYYNDGARFPASSPWYQPYLDYAKRCGIVTKDFAAYNVPISRADYAVLLGASLPDRALPQISDIEDGAIPDVKTGASYYDAVYRLYRAGVLTGNDAKGTFTPDSRITRGAAAAIASRMADASLRKAITMEKAPFEPVSADKLANRKSLSKNLTEAQLQAAYDAALEIVTPLAKCSTEEQLRGIAAALRRLFDSGMTYSTSAPHYSDAYGYFILKTASCAGCARATGLCLNILGIPYEHVNEGQWSHQWCRVNVNGVYWICDAYGLYCGPEPAPYQHPYL
ncbi:MAG: S-layer homology domain-containing protein [Oscillospiraceae bacterium]